MEKDRRFIEGVACFSCFWVRNMSRYPFVTDIAFHPYHPPALYNIQLETYPIVIPYLFIGCRRQNTINPFRESLTYRYNHTTD